MQNLYTCASIFETASPSRKVVLFTGFAAYDRHRDVGMVIQNSLESIQLAPQSGGTVREPRCMGLFVLGWFLPLECLG